MTGRWAYGPAYAPWGRGFIRRFIFLILPLPLLLFFCYYFFERLWGYAFALVLGMAARASFWGRERVLQGAFKADARRVHLLGIPIDKLDLSRAVDKLEEFIMSKRGSHVVCTPDTVALMRAQWDGKLRAIYQRADLVTADGIGLVWASKFLGVPLPGRVAGIDVVYELCRRADKNGSKPYGLFLLGSKPGVAEEAAARLARAFPGLKVVGAHHGYFSRAEQERVIREIQQSAPDVLLVGMGVPKQELFIMEHKTKLNVPVIIGVGGSFDVLSGRIPRAPKFWQRAGLEWAYRILIEPRRLWRARLIPIFLLNVLLLKLFTYFEDPAVMPSSS